MPSRACCLAAYLLALCPAFAQTKVTAAEYARAETFMAYNTTPLVAGSVIRPTWLPDDRFWYRVTTGAGSEFVLFNAAKGTRAPAFDHAKIAAALSSASGRAYAAAQLPFQEIEFSTDDSKRVATFQQDQRGVGEMYFVDTKVGHPTLQAWKYLLPGDAVSGVSLLVAVSRTQRFQSRMKAACFLSGESTSGMAPPVPPSRPTPRPPRPPPAGLPAPSTAVHFEPWTSHFHPPSA